MSARPDDDLAGVRISHGLIGPALQGLDDATARRPSRLPGWSVGHVITHLARNADGLRGMVEGAARGEVAPMYPGGMDQRTADIENGASRSAAALVADVAGACAALEAAFAALDEAAWAEGRGSAFGNERPVRALPFIRRRETEVHLADIGLATFTFDQWSDDYVAEELRRQEEQRGGLPAGADTLAPKRRLAWLLGREVVPELGDPGAWG